MWQYTCNSLCQNFLLNMCQVSREEEEVPFYLKGTKHIKEYVLLIEYHTKKNVLRSLADISNQLVTGNLTGNITVD